MVASVWQFLKGIFTNSSLQPLLLASADHFFLKYSAFCYIACIQTCILSIKIVVEIQVITKYVHTVSHSLVVLLVLLRGLAQWCPPTIVACHHCTSYLGAKPRVVIYHNNVYLTNVNNLTSVNTHRLPLYRPCCYHVYCMATLVFRVATTYFQDLQEPQDLTCLYQFFVCIIE